MAAPRTLGQPLDFPADRLMKNIPCSKCGRDVQVGERTLMVFCAACSANMGVKK